MKKILVALTVAVLFAFAAPAFAATNPFMDVPASHWAYDAVAQLASRGVISGYPDGTYKGPQPATRYEIASIIARSLAYVDMEKASKQDVDMMRRLIVEFSDELSALGVRVDGFDERLGQLEKDLGGWKFSGELRFDVKLSEYGDKDAKWYGLKGKSDFDLNRYRMLIQKRVDENTSVTVRLNGQSAAFDRYFVTTKLGYDITMVAGRQVTDWEAEAGFAEPGYWDDWIGDDAFVGFLFKKSWSIANLQVALSRWNDELSTAGTRIYPGYDGYTISAKLDGEFSEKFRAGAMGYFYTTDTKPTGSKSVSGNTIGLYAGFKFHPSVELKGLYYFQDGSMFEDPSDKDNTGYAWKAVLDVNQDLLKFTSLWLEYGMVEKGFPNYNDAYSWANDSFALQNHTDDLTVYGVRAKQQWNEKWYTMERYWHGEDDAKIDDDQFTFAVGYQWTPSTKFELSYDVWDGDTYDGESVIQFSTVVNF
jgi:hypothetical protein